MTKALEIALSRWGKTSPNPAVGAVIVKNGSILSVGGTQAFGSDHAEITAIKNASCDLKGAEIYVTLEPCSHYGKTPPCADRIIKEGFSKVYIPLIDPNPKVAGEGVRKLKEAGVEVVFMDDFREKSLQLLQPFLHRVKSNRPFVIHKAAMTLDGRTATHSGDSKWISCIKSRMIVHRLRSLVDGIIVGKGTFEKDNPSLNVRLEDFAGEKLENVVFSGYESFFLDSIVKSSFTGEISSPKRIVCGLPSHISLESNIMFDENFVFFEKRSALSSVEKRDDSSVVNKLLDSGKIILLDAESEIDMIDGMMKHLYDDGLLSLLLEGGSTLASRFLESNYIDQSVYFFAPKILGGGVPLFNGRGGDLISESSAVGKVSTCCIDSDLLYSGYLNFLEV